MTYDPSANPKDQEALAALKDKLIHGSSGRNDDPNIGVGGAGVGGAGDGRVDYSITINDMTPVPVKRPYREPDPNSQDIEYAAANHFLADVGLPLVPDAVDQLVQAFLPALKIICERGYHPEGNTWREAGWRGVLTDVRKKSNRLWYRSWIKGQFDEDSATDLINFAGFYKRLRNKGPEWGTWGPPGPDIPPEPGHRRADPMGSEADNG